jgi:hypothetical protein
MTCPDCGKAELRFRECDSVETHGLDCGPYERFYDEWWECPECDAVFTDRELEALS